jgi:hypothetical protein
LSAVPAVAMWNCLPSALRLTSSRDPSFSAREPTAQERVQQSSEVNSKVDGRLYRFANVYALLALSRSRICVDGTEPLGVYYPCFQAPLACPLALRPAPRGTGTPSNRAQPELGTGVASACPWPSNAGRPDLSANRKPQSGSTLVGPFED